MTNNITWWKGAVIYQIYPRSFKDSNNDGIGDLAGITSKLDYIASLNVDAIWLSPFFTSPMKDFGYDVSDYCGVDPLFGTLQDFKDLVVKAHQLGLKVIIDQVYSHTSDQHAWFKESRADKTNPKANWYVWADPKPDGTPPNNWLSLFGGSAWQWDTPRQQYFLHNFLTSQPDLNFHSMEVQDAILNAAKFWLELGVDGFRLDVVNMYFHDETLADNGVADSPEKMFVGVDPNNPFSKQHHVHQMCRDDNLEFLKRLRNLLDFYPGSTTVGEIGAPDGLSYMAQYTSNGDKLHMAYTFELLSDKCEPLYLKDNMMRIADSLKDGWPCFALSNHDVVRSATRWTQGSNYKSAKAKAMLVFLLTQRGTPCIYQGEELGLPEADVPFDKIVDPFGIEFWPVFKGRDGCRTPMAWENQADLGFGSELTRQWLPADQSHQSLAVSEQEVDSASMLHFIKEFLAWRKNNIALLTGSINWLDSGDPVLLFERVDSSQKLIVAINFSEHSELCPDVDDGAAIVWSSHEVSSTLKPYQCTIWQV
ncbi:alpha-glucosidase [Reinekea sp.]|jgi:alpha-glucosidase|uniref:alpha-glucosidase n=1 Tax=Reinekea sp. TaxID=1970455 RepID=UPI00398956D8